MIKCTCCGGFKLQLYLESGGYSHYVCTECRHSISIPKEKEATTMWESEISELKEENRCLQEENATLKAEIEDLKETIKGYSVVNGFLRRSYAQKSRRKRWF